MIPENCWIKYPCHSCLTRYRIEDLSILIRWNGQLAFLCAICMSDSPDYAYED